MFKSRSASQGAASASAAPSIETLRRRARHRLIGASVLVLAGVLGFPLLFDTAPRPLTADVPIDIPARGSAAPAQPGRPSAAVIAQATDAANNSASGSQVSVDEALDERESLVPPSAPAAPVAAPAPAPAPKPAPTPVPKPVPAAKAPVTPPAAKPAPKPAEPPPARPEAGGERFIVQVGAFADAQRAREVRLKLERAGLKTYTHEATTPEGKRIRVRLGPFSSRAEAEKAAAQAKAQGLPAAILTL